MSKQAVYLCLEQATIFLLHKTHGAKFGANQLSEPRGLDIPEVVRRGPKLSCEKLDARDGDKALPMLPSSMILYAKVQSLQYHMGGMIDHYIITRVGQCKIMFDLMMTAATLWEDACTLHKAGTVLTRPDTTRLFEMCV